MSCFPETIAVVGVPGAGKTTVCRILSGRIRHRYINYGDLMLKIATERSMAGTREELFSLPLEDQHGIWLEAASRIQGTGCVLVDLHGLDQSPQGYIVSLPVEFIDPDLIIILESDPLTVLERRMADTRKRIIETPESLREHMEMLRLSMAVCAALKGSALSIVSHRDPETTAKKIIGIIESLGDR
ncbi:adenylate kinase [Methanothermobacter wolfeii]|uniref:Adenylate kinase n=1 Tax=Methanothermobacter wolfeii TaxID=145261 RepID=A0A9E7UN94_METWO|nr:MULTISPECIES: adenylate kinase [Methanothermobacter]MDI6702874.1 adenylate kinase [Methanothermobacter wolfeii]MDI6841403.1 adenylate kinase [Methanothermobacter wolfeii]NLM02690.1 adenylate kinase [Methanothermobacter wolfeii]QHN05778.1 adenylate kinase [Methanothermobacter sp. THM-1]UXH31927.1 adenylate kinase [Methanothermobacter wolfeii]